MLVPLTVRDFLARARTVFPDRIGLVDEADQPAPPFGGTGGLTYGQLAAHADAQAAWLDAREVPVGGRVAVISQNSARLLTSFFGVCGSGRVLVPVNFRLAQAEIDFILQHSGAEVVLVDPVLRDAAPGALVFGECDDEVFGNGGTGRTWEGDEGATATINYTSGTTARPKGVQLTHRNLWLNGTLMALHTGLTDRDVYLHTLPMFHANGWGMPFGLTGLGVKQVVIRQIDGAEILRRVRDHGVTVMCAAPAVVAAVLAAAAEWQGPIPGAGVTRIVVAGAPPPTRTIERVETELGWEFIQLYGLTETSPLLTFNRAPKEWDGATPSERARLLSRQGPPGLGVSLRVSDEGEVLARGNTVLEGYWQQPDATAVALDGGWFHTGDGGTLEDGFLTISDRRKDVIISGGENVTSIEVEDAIMSHPAVTEVAVIGVPDEKWGELVLALVVTSDPALTEADVIAHCRQSLAGYKCPKRVEFRDELARTATGKLQKFKLREPYWAGREKQVN